MTHDLRIGRKLEGARAVHGARGRPRRDNLQFCGEAKPARHVLRRFISSYQKGIRSGSSPVIRGVCAHHLGAN